MSRAFELLTSEAGVTVRRSADSLRIDPDEEGISAVNALLVSEEIRVYELSPAQETLEEAFLRLTKTGAVPPNV